MFGLGDKKMKCILKNKKGISNVIGYLFSFAIASMVMFTSVLITRNIMDETVSRVGDLQAQSIANRVADAVLEAAAVGLSVSPEEYRKTLDLPIYIANRDYYVEITEKFVYVNTSDGVITKSSSTYGADKFGIGIDNTRIYAGNKIDITVKRSDYVYKLDFGTGTSTSHSPVEAGYYRVTNKSLPDPPWVDTGLGYQARVPILIDNDSPEDLLDVPVQIVLNPLNFDYSMANVTIDSSSTVKSDLTFYDLSEQIFSKISISPSSWDPSWFYTYYDASSTAEEVTVSILSISGAYDASYIDEDSIWLRRVGHTKKASCIAWDSDSGVARFDGKEVLEVLENGNHYLKNPSYTVEVFGLLKNGQEFTGSQEITITNARYVKATVSGVIQDAINSAPDGATIFIENGVYNENLGMNHLIPSNTNLIGQSRSGVIINPLLTGGNIIDINSMDNVNIDSLTIDSEAAGPYKGILIRGASTNINITNCEIKRCRNGIEIIGGSSNIAIYDCNTHSNSGDSGGDSNGIKIVSSNHIRITKTRSHNNIGIKADGLEIDDCDNIIVDHSCYFYANKGSESGGIKIFQSNNIRINNSHIFNNGIVGATGTAGILIYGTTHVESFNIQIENCTIYDNHRGISIINNGELGNTIKNCEIKDNDIGVLISSQSYVKDRVTFSNHADNNTITHSNIYNNRWRGISLTNSLTTKRVSNTVITHCNIHNNGEENDQFHDGIFLAGANHTTISHCNIFNNADDGIDISRNIGVIGSSFNQIHNNNIYNNGRIRSSGTGIYISKLCTDNSIYFNNFGYDYDYMNEGFLVDNGKYAVDDYEGLVGSPNNWNNNFWGNKDPVSNTYTIPNSDYLNPMEHKDNAPSATRYNTDIGDYIIVDGTTLVSGSEITIRGNESTHDCYVRNMPPGNKDNYGGDDTLYVRPNLADTRHIYIRFDLTDIQKKIPEGSTITSATLQLYYKGHTTGAGFQDPEDREYQCERLNPPNPWGEYTWDWNKAQQVTGWGSSVITTVPTALNWMSWNVKDDVTGYLAGTIPNHGWRIRDISSLPVIPPQYQGEFHSAESGINQPQLVIEYTSSGNPIKEAHYNPRKIQTGIDNVIRHGTVDIKDISGGLPYVENLEINKSLNLIGKNNVVINGDGNENVITINQSIKNVFIESLTIENGNTGVYISDKSGPFSSPDPIDITNCIIRDNSQDGVYAGNSNVNIKNCYIHSNTGAGIHLKDDDNTILNSAIKNNDIGIYLQDSKNNNILNCFIEGNNKGIYLTSSRSNLIENCVLKENIDSGIKLQSSGLPFQPNRIINCTIVGTGSSGVSRGIYLVSSNRNIITNCNISKNNFEAVNITSSGHNTITKCVIHDNNDYSVYIESGSNNEIYHNKFMNNHNTLHADAFDAGNNNKWDNGYLSGGNLWDKYYDASQGAFDYKWGERENSGTQPYYGSDGIADDPYKIDGPQDSYDYYPFCRRPLDIKYYIDHWNPDGESVIFLNMDLPSRSSKYIYMYYGSKEPAVIRSMEDVTVFFDNFDAIDSSVWAASSDIYLSEGILNLPSSGKNISSIYEIIPKINPPSRIDNQKTVSNSMYIVEAKMNISSNAKGELAVMCTSSPSARPPPGFFISVDNENNFFNISNFHITGPGVYEGHDCNTTIPQLDDWIRLRTYIYQSHENYTAQGATFESKTAHVKGIIYDNNSYANKGSVSHLDGMYKSHTDTFWQGDYFVLDEGIKIGSGAGLVQVDWIRVMNAPVLPPTVTIGAMESARYGWDAEVDAGNYIPPPGVFDNPFIPGPLLRDYNSGSESATFVITDLPEGEYTVTLAMGRADSECTATTVTFNNNLGFLILPATDNGSFVTRSKTINWGGGSLEIQFSAKTNEQWTINAMTIEKGRRGVKVDYA
jgi:parallel beta-helix repeat protein